MPGVDVLSDIISGPASRSRAPGATYFCPMQAERGPTDVATLVRSMAEFEYHYGTRQSYTPGYDDLATFFAEGGSRAYVGRVVGTTPVLATSTLVDRAGAPLNTLRIDAKNAGSWGNALTREVANGTDANTFKVTISGTPDGVDEVFDNLASPAAAALTISAESRWVNAVDLGSVTVAPNNNPAVAAEAALAAGTDDRATIVAADYTDAADDLFTKALGAGAIAVAGQPSSAVGAALLDHAAANDRLAILFPTSGQTPTQAKAAAAALDGDADAEFGRMEYPWVKIPDGSGSTRTISPGGYIAAVRARAHETTGPWRAGAGEISQARFVVGVERELTRAEGDDLDASNVNAIRVIAGTVRSYGARSLSSDAANWRFYTYRDLINDIEVECELALEAYAFRVIDGKNHAFSDLEAELRGIAARYASAGALFPRQDPTTGAELDPGYSVDTGPGVNTPATIDAGEIHGRLAVRPSPTGALVVVTVSKAAFSAPL